MGVFVLSNDNSIFSASLHGDIAHALDDSTQPTSISKCDVLLYVNCNFTKSPTCGKYGEVLGVVCFSQSGGR